MEGVPGEILGLVSLLGDLGFTVLGYYRVERYYIPGVEYVIELGNCDREAWRRASQIKADTLPKELAGKTIIVCIDYDRRSIEEGEPRTPESEPYELS